MGYKETIVGIIPVDWEPSSIGELFQFQGGSQPVRDTFIFSEKKGYVRLLQIRDYKSDKYASYIPINLARKFCTKDDIMIGRYGPPIFQILKGMDGAYNVALIKALPNTKLNKTYAYYYLIQDKLYQFIEKLSQRSSGQTGVDLHELKGYPLPLPPKPEQTAIANVLSDTDALIQSLEKLIAKKRAIKQGAMQKLLTGKRRIPGFEGKWEEKNISEIALVCRGASPRPIDNPIWFDESSKIGWVRISDVTSSIKFLTTTTQKLSKKGIDKSRFVPAGSLLMSICATVGRPIFNHIDVCIHDGFVLFQKVQCNIEFLYYYLAFIEEDWAKHGQTGSQMNLNTTLINSTALQIPPTTEEQTAIATILSDMDSELTALESKLSKYRAIKQGMMQELLTGKIRLNHDSKD